MPAQMKRVRPSLPRSAPEEVPGERRRPDRPPVLDQAGEQPVLGLRGVGEPEALGREQEDRSSEPTVVDSAASRFASATREARSACALGAHGQTGRDEGDDEDGGQADGQPPGAAGGPAASRRARSRASISSASARALDASRNRRSTGRDVVVRRRPPSPARRRAGRRGTARRPGRPRRCPLPRGGRQVPAHRPARRRRPPASGPAAATRSAAPRARPRGGRRRRRAAGGRRRSRRPPGAPSPPSPSRSSSASGTGRRTSAPPSSTSASRTSRRRASSWPALVQGGVGGLRRPGQRAGDAAGLEVAGQGEPVAPAPLPGADQRRRQQRQRAGPAQDVGHDGVEQLRIRPSGRRRPPARGRPRAARRRSAQGRGRARRRAAR